MRPFRFGSFAVAASLFVGASSANGSGAKPPVRASFHRPAAPYASCSAPPSTTSFVGVNNSNYAPVYASSILGGVDNDACDSYSAVVGGYNNSVFSGAGSAFYSAIVAGNTNTIAATESFIGGGTMNSIQLAPANTSYQSSFNSIVGGEGNTIGASGNDAGHHAAIAGGLDNGIYGHYGFVGAGQDNQITSDYDFIGGGLRNTTSGAYATVLGGYGNVAAGKLSFAGGFDSQATRDGTFVWSDFTSKMMLAPTADNEFVARASGGVTFFSNATQTCGVEMLPGASAWVPLPSCPKAKAADDPASDRTEIAALRSRIAAIEADEKALRAQVRLLLAARR